MTAATEEDGETTEQTARLSAFAGLLRLPSGSPPSFVSLRAARGLVSSFLLLHR